MEKKKRNKKKKVKIDPIKKELLNLVEQEKKIDSIFPSKERMERIFDEDDLFLI